MKKATLALLTVAALAIFAAPAFAGEVTLGQSGTSGGLNAPTSTLQFTSNGSGNFTLKFANGTNGVAFDNFGGGVENGYYSIVQSVGSSITGHYNSSTGLFDVTQSPTTNLTFHYGFNSPGGIDNGLLTGMLTLVSLQQTPSASTGVFNEALVVNLMNIDPNGALASYFANGTGIVQLTLHFKTTTNLMTAASGATVNAFISTGSVQPVSAAPEPPSLVMAGVGLIAMAGLVRRVKVLSA
jgi:hypothetical protein